MVRAPKLIPHRSSERQNDPQQNKALPGLAWVQIEPSAANVDRRLEMLGVAETTGFAFDVLDLAVEPLASRVGDRMLVVGQDVVDVLANRLGRVANRLQPAVCRSEILPLSELPA